MADALSETLRSLLNKYYTICCRCRTRDDEVRILPCLHVFCTKCLQSIVATPPQLTKYKRSRRFTCPSCQWPQYLHSDGIEGYPAAHPLLPTVSSEKAECPFPDLSMETYREATGNLILDHCIGRHGVDDGCFTNITGMSVDESVAACPRVVVSDASQHKITVYGVDGKFCMTLKLEESIRDVCVNKNGDIFVVVVEKDYLIVHFDRDGNQKENKLHTIGPQYRIIHQEPFGLCIDERGHFIASFLMADSVCRFDEECSHVCAIGNTGKGIIKFNGPYYLARTSKDYTVVSDTCNHRVKIHNQSNGLLQLQLGSTNCEPGRRLGEFFFPRGVCVDKDDSIYVADTGNYRVQKFDEYGNILGCPVEETWRYGENVKPTNVFALRDGRLLVAMQGHKYCKVHVYCKLLPQMEVKPSLCLCLLGCYQCCTHKGYEQIN